MQACAGIIAFKIGYLKVHKTKEWAVSQMTSMSLRMRHLRYLLYRHYPANPINHMRNVNNLCFWRYSFSVSVNNFIIILDRKVKA